MVHIYSLPLVMVICVLLFNSFAFLNFYSFHLLRWCFWVGRVEQSRWKNMPTHHGNVTHPETNCRVLSFTPGACARQGEPHYRWCRRGAEVFRSRPWRGSSDWNAPRYWAFFRSVTEGFFFFRPRRGGGKQCSFGCRCAWHVLSVLLVHTGGGCGQTCEERAEHRITTQRITPLHNIRKYHSSGGPPSKEEEAQPEEEGELKWPKGRRKGAPRNARWSRKLLVPCFPRAPPQGSNGYRQHDLTHAQITWNKESWRCFTTSA